MKRILGILSVLVVLGAVGYVFFGQEKAATAPATEVSTTEVTQQSSSEEDPLPDVKTSDWQLLLVGPDNALKEDNVKLATLPNGMEVDERIVEPYDQLIKAASKAGYNLMLVSAYRSVAYQEQIYNQSIADIMVQQGVDEAEATKQTKEYFTVPGHSEHHTGLAIDVVDDAWYNQGGDVLTAAYGKQDSAKWLAQHAREYGFILRYPEGAEKTTKINYEPWHFRYVGKDSAKYIEEHHLTLEAYLELLKKAGK